MCTCARVVGERACSQRARAGGRGYACMRACVLPMQTLAPGVGGGNDMGPDGTILEGVHQRSAGSWIEPHTRGLSRAFKCGAFQGVVPAQSPGFARKEHWINGPRSLGRMEAQHHNVRCRLGCGAAGFVQVAHPAFRVGRHSVRGLVEVFYTRGDTTFDRRNGEMAAGF